MIILHTCRSRVFVKLPLVGTVYMCRGSYMYMYIYACLCYTTVLVHVHVHVQCTCTCTCRSMYNYMKVHEQYMYMYMYMLDISRQLACMKLGRREKYQPYTVLLGQLPRLPSSYMPFAYTVLHAKRAKTTFLKFL